MIRKLKCFFGLHDVIEIITRRRGDDLMLNYFHCKHCGHDVLQDTYNKIYGNGKVRA